MRQTTAYPFKQDIVSSQIGVLPRLRSPLVEIPLFEVENFAYYACFIDPILE